MREEKEEQEKLAGRLADGRDISALGDEYFAVSYTEEGAWCEVRIQKPRLDVVVSPHLKSLFMVLTGHGYSRLVFNLEGCQYCDSSGLGAIIMGYKLCKKAEGALVLLHVGAPVERLLKLAKIESLLSIVNNKELLSDIFKKNHRR